jgi:hypothetical protein
MAVPWKIDIPVKRMLIGEVEQVTAAHGDHFLGGRIAAVITHNSTDQPGSKQHIGPFDKDNHCSLFLGGHGSRAPGPPATNDDNLHKFFSLS